MSRTISIITVTNLHIQPTLYMPPEENKRASTLYTLSEIMPIKFTDESKFYYSCGHTSKAFSQYWTLLCVIILLVGRNISLQICEIFTYKLYLKITQTLQINISNSLQVDFIPIDYYSHKLCTFTISKQWNDSRLKGILMKFETLQPRLPYVQN